VNDLGLEKGNNILRISLEYGRTFGKGLRALVEFAKYAKCFVYQTFPASFESSLTCQKSKISAT
jgi:hypothetical protein